MICEMCFKKIYNLKRHLKEVHGDADTSWITLSAAALHAICVQRLLHSIGDLLRHFEAKHGIVARRDKLKFNLLKEFSDWREAKDGREHVRFILHDGPKGRDEGVLKRRPGSGPMHGKPPTSLEQQHIMQGLVASQEGVTTGDHKHEDLLQEA
ncbi:uncharacterized protein LOC115311694 isoform X1 [Ixodes scapularis]|uniref:uncharacterized protein LOC120836590 isoform X1 n=1 Tax=Ixodes scapularis TaxID=6945 RepID=UPI001A9E8209|nr:uncharacterized protein LOC120836590 isoform X1 [Ixodes scapularis]XP_042146020.1 uncharacterized protein LOC120836590 isoform X1 [Ixodes scapularis]XP_042148356.1 uncharacterized protein LOC115311694 isoform X1 [Ixodes scapularis]